jgi:hypothetical protein
MPIRTLFLAAISMKTTWPKKSLSLYLRSTARSAEVSRERSGAGIGWTRCRADGSTPLITGKPLEGGQYKDAITNHHSGLPHWCCFDRSNPQDDDMTILISESILLLLKNRCIVSKNTCLYSLAYLGIGIDIFIKCFNHCSSNLGFDGAVHMTKPPRQLRVLDVAGTCQHLDCLNHQPFHLTDNTLHTRPPCPQRSRR